MLRKAFQHKILLYFKWASPEPISTKLLTRKYLLPEASCCPTGPSHLPHAHHIVEKQTCEHTDLVCTAWPALHGCWHAECIYCLKNLKSRGRAQNEAMKPFKYSYGWTWQCYSKLNFNETQKMLNLQKVYQRKGHLKDTNAPGPRCRHRRITTCQGHSRSRICKLHRHPDVRRPALCKYAGFDSQGKAN